MKTLNYCTFIDDPIFSDFTIFYMPGLKLSDVDSSKVIVNLENKSAYVYVD